MGAIAGFLCRDAMQKEDVLKSMMEALKGRGALGEGRYKGELVALGSVRCGGDEIQPIIKTLGGRRLAVVFSGELYNANALIRELEQAGERLVMKSCAEIVLHSYLLWGDGFVKRLNGVFAFAITDGTMVYLARDPLGVQPLFYHRYHGQLAFASQIRALLQYPGVSTVVDESGVGEIMAVLPARTPGCGIFRDVNELLPGHYMIFDGRRAAVERYWQITPRPHTESYEDTLYHVRHLLQNSILAQAGEGEYGCMLSGGLDSSIITGVLAKHLLREERQLRTYSVDYEGNGQHFQKNLFQPERDEAFAELMVTESKTDHRNCILSIDALSHALLPAMEMRDLPGMADIDASLYLFLKEIGKTDAVVLSGECADEIFGGYPWFYREDLRQTGLFPWSRDLSYRESFLKVDLNVDLKEHIASRYQSFMEQLPPYHGAEEEREMFELFSLNLSYFGANLLERTERMSSHSGVKVRMPFADAELIQYVFSIPWGMKYKNGREKGLLRDAMKEFVPTAIYERKKSPYPKTYHPQYGELMRRRLKEIASDEDAPIYALVERRALQDLLYGTVNRPWFGQLMAGPQLMAYLIQLNGWLKTYQVKIRL